MKKALMNASVASMIYKFNMSNIEILESLGYQVDVACNFGKENPISQEQIADFKNILNRKDIRIFETTCPRSVIAIGKMIKAYKQLKKIAETEEYELVHTQSPIGGVVCRLAFRKERKNNTKVIYQAHGFHFYKGAPIQNWLIFYPIEKFCSRFTDVLITINKEDYELAKKRMKAKKVVYVPGVGIDLKAYSKVPNQIKDAKQEENLQLRQNIGCQADDILLFSVGELNVNKNHSTVIRALGALNAKGVCDKQVHYAIAGSGELLENLKKLAKECEIENTVHFLGYRTDVKDWYEISDVFVFPSYREGLSVSLMEAMASGNPVIASRIRGNTDLIDEQGGYLFAPDNVMECEQKIEEALDSNEELKQKGFYNCNKIRQFDKRIVENTMQQIYEAAVNKEY